MFAAIHLCFSFRFISYLSNSLPFFMVIAWTYTVAMIIRSVVYEKELRLKEVMKVIYCRFVRAAVEFLISSSRPSPGQRKKINFFFCTSLWCLKRFYEGRKGTGRKGFIYLWSFFRHFLENHTTFSDLVGFWNKDFINFR